MATRFFEERPWSFFHFGAAFAAHQYAGRRLVSMTLSGPPDDLRVGAVWTLSPDAPRQTLSALQGWVDFDRERRERLGESGPAFLAGARGPDGGELYLAVWETYGADQFDPRVARAESFEGLVERCATEENRHRHYPRSLCVIPPPPGQLAPSRFLATLWPVGTRRFAWNLASFHASDLHEREGSPDRGANTTALAVGYFPWLVVPYWRTRQLARGWVRERYVLTSWRDVLFTPWTEDPFSRSAHREREIRCDVSVDRATFESLRAAREASGEEPLAIGASGSGSDERFAAVYARAGEEPLRRRFFVQGIGDGRNARQQPAQVPRVLASDVGPIEALFARLHAEEDAAGVDEIDEVDPGRVAALRAEIQGIALRRLDPGAATDAPAARSDGEATASGTAPSAGETSAPSARAGGAPRSRGLVDGEDLMGERPASRSADADARHPGPEAERLGPQARPRAELGGRCSGAPRNVDLDIHPIDAAAFGFMEQFGVRGAQVAVNRDGKGAYDRAYTWAEEGYPITRTTHRIRWGSCSKALTASGLAPHYMRIDPTDPDAGLRRSFAGELGIQREEPAFMTAVTIARALQHKTGIQQTGFSSETVYEAIHGASAPRWMADSLLNAGDMRSAFERWPEPVVTDWSQSYHYNNFVYIALCELWSKLRANGAWNDYVRAAEDLLPPGVFPPGFRVLTGKGHAAARANGEVTYHPGWPAVSPSPHDGGEYALQPYTRNPDFGSGAGWWALSAREMALVMRQLSTGENPRFPTPAEKRFLWERRLGWIRTSGQFEFPSDGGIPALRRGMWHNGGMDGCNSFILHIWQGTHSIDIVASFNGDGLTALGGAFCGIMVDAAVEAERRGAWAPVDLWSSFGSPA